MKTSNLFKRNLPAVITFSLLALALIGTYTWISLLRAIDIPQGDHWRWIPRLIAQVEGNSSFYDYVTSEFVALSHSHMLTLTVKWLNFHYFSLNYSLESYVGLFSTILLVGVLMKQLIFIYRESLGSSQILLIMTAVLLIILAPRNIVSWSLVQFEFFYLLNALFYFVILDNVIKSRTKPPILFLFVAWTFYFGDAMGSAAMFASIVFLIIYPQKPNFKILVGIISTIVLCLLIAKWILPTNVPHSKYSKLESLIYILNNLDLSLQFIVNSFAQAVIDIGVLKHLFIDKGQLIHTVIGYFVIFLTALASIQYFRFHKQCIKSSLPMLLIIFSTICIAGALLTRLQMFDENYANAARYIRLNQIGFIGSTWILLATYFHTTNVDLSPARTTKPPGFALFPVMILSLLVVSYSCSLFHNWKFRLGAARHHEKTISVIQQYSIDKQVDVGARHNRCANNFCWESIQFLKENQLSIFREDHSTYFFHPKK